MGWQTKLEFCCKSRSLLANILTTLSVSPLSVFVTGQLTFTFCPLSVSVSAHPNPSTHTPSVSSFPLIQDDARLHYGETPLTPNLGGWRGWVEGIKCATVRDDLLGLGFGDPFGFGVWGSYNFEADEIESALLSAPLKILSAV